MELPKIDMEIVQSGPIGRATVMACLCTLPVTKTILYLVDQDVHVLTMFDALVSVDCATLEGAQLYAAMGVTPDKLLVITQFIAELVERHLDKQGLSVYQFAENVLEQM